MLAYQIVAGFSEIKSELRNRVGIAKNLVDLHLWFSLEDDVLYAHDYHGHKKCIALAVYDKNKNTWLITFRGGTYGKKLIENAINTSEINDLIKDFNGLYISHGYIAFR